MALFLRSFAQFCIFLCTALYGLSYHRCHFGRSGSQERGGRVVSQQGRVEVDVEQRILREAGPYNSHRGVWGLGFLVLSKRDLGLSCPLPVLYYNILRTYVPNQPPLVSSYGAATKPRKYRYKINKYPVPPASHVAHEISEHQLLTYEVTLL